MRHFGKPEEVSHMLRKLSGLLFNMVNAVVRILNCKTVTRFSQNSSNDMPASQFKPQVLSREHHQISRKQISRAALDVLYGLHKAGYDAYLVGGALRDMLTGSEPKDFDVVTNATPEQARDIFRRSRIIGRRFRLVHVMFGRDMIEVSTFRAHNREDDQAGHSLNDEGLILRDNAYGTIEEDALRRDFTINALYYNIANFALYDFVGSLKDIKRKQIRMIGDPEQRYREDPVRMLRAARFAAKLGFDMAAETEQPVRPLATLLYQVPAARLFDEVLKLFLTGHARASFASLQRYSLFDVLFPETGKRLHDSEQRDIWQKLIEQAAINTDARIAQQKPVTPAFLYAVLLWPAVHARLEKNIAKGVPYAPSMAKAAGQVLNEQIKVTSIPKRFSSAMREIWDFQGRLDNRHGRRAEALMEHPRFRAAYDFLLLREQAGEITPGLGDWWTQYQQADSIEKEQLVRNLGQQSGGAKRRRRRPPRQA